MGMAGFGQGLVVDSDESRKYHQAARTGRFPAGQSQGAGEERTPWSVHPEIQGNAMILEVERRTASQDIAVLELRGRLLMGNDSRQVEWALGELLKDGTKKVVVDLRQLDAIDSTGVGILVMCNAKLQKAGGVMRIVSSDGIVESTLQMTHVDRIVKFFPSVEEATEKFDLA